MSWSIWSGFNSALGGFSIVDLGMISPRATSSRGLRIGVDPARELVNHRLRHVADHGEAAGHVAVNGAIADGEFALVSSGEKEVTELVRERHQNHSAQTRLHVFFRRVFRQAGEDFANCALKASNAFAIGICRHLMPRLRESASASSMLPRDE